jgi:hypothetical protein
MNFQQRKAYFRAQRRQSKPQMAFMMKLVILFFVTAFAATANAQVCEERGLARYRVQDVSPVLGDFYDTHVKEGDFGFDFVGKSYLCGEPLEYIEYWAQLLTYDPETLELVTYAIEDRADVIGFTGNGAQYTVQSRQNLGEIYDIVFLRRSPDNQMVEVNERPYVVPNYDQTTIMRVLKQNEDDSLTIHEMDFRGEVN